jgi:hypothetical protein
MKKLVNFVKEARGELKKVEWPDKDSVVNSTLVVSFHHNISLALGARISSSPLCLER